MVNELDCWLYLMLTKKNKNNMNAKCFQNGSSTRFQKRLIFIVLVL